MKHPKYAAVQNLGPERHLELNPRVASRIRIFEELIRANNANNGAVHPGGHGGAPAKKQRWRQPAGQSTRPPLAPTFSSSSSTSSSSSAGSPRLQRAPRATAAAAAKPVTSTSSTSASTFRAVKTSSSAATETTGARLPLWRRRCSQHLLDGSNLSLAGSSSSGYLSSATPEPAESGTPPTRADAGCDAEERQIEREIFSRFSTDDDDDEDEDEIQWSDLDGRAAADSDPTLSADVEIFFRAGVLSHLEDQRDERVASRVVRFQAQCRGFLARKRLAKLKVQDTAIRCIQRNVRKLQAVRAWPWWRLMLRLSPLLNVHRTEEELKSRTEEAENLRVRVAALEKERADLKYVSDRLETKVSELTADLAEEHSTSILATERLEAETAQRMKLEKEVNDLESKCSRLSSENEKMEMEVLIARSTGLNGDQSAASDEDDDGQPNIYKQKYERTLRELDFTKQRLQQQHEDDLEQMVTLKKQLEKKLNDAYEEVEEQRQVVAQWKRKSQRHAAELNDTRLLHEEQTNRNALLEKKQRKFDAELQGLQEELRQERLHKERVLRERDATVSEKLTLEQTLQSVQLDFEMRGERLAALSKELEEMTNDGRSDADMAALRRSKNELELKVKDQEEELDEMAGQIQMLEAARLRLEMCMEQMRKEYKKEVAQRDDEMEDIRCSAQKKVKALEAQLETEHEERTLLVREKHELERQLVAMTEQAAQALDDETIHKLKRDLKRTKALLKDAHSQLERARSETPSKVLLRQLRNQLEDSEFARTAAVKGRQHAEQELVEAQTQLEEAQRLRSEAEERYLSTNRERSNIQSQVDDLEMELSEVMRKYKASVAQLSVDQITIQDQASQLTSLEQEKFNLKEQVAELSSRLENMETDSKSVHTQKRMELKVKELESRIDLEQTTKSRLEAQVARLKEMVEKDKQELESVRCKEQLSQESSKRLQRQLREVREELNNSEQRDADTMQQIREFEQRIELLESENATLVKDLSLAVRRIEDLQAAMQGEMDSSDSEQDGSDDSDSDSDTSVHTFLSQRKYGSTSGVSSGSFQTRDGAPSPTADSTSQSSPSSSQLDLRSQENLTTQDESFA